MPILLKGLKFYFSSHFKVIPKTPYLYYLITPFLIQGFLLVFMIIYDIRTIKKFWKECSSRFDLHKFFFFYLIFQIGGTFADRFRYVLPTLIPSAYYISAVAFDKNMETNLHFSDRKTFFYFFHYTSIGYSENSLSGLWKRYLRFSDSVFSLFLHKL